MSALQKAKEHRVKAGYAAPLLELGSANARAVRETTELYLGRRQIKFLESEDNNPFKLFVNLESLWLSHNKISDIGALSTCIRLKELFLDFNHINHIRRKDITYMFLETLSLENNQLRDLPSLLHALSKLGFLRNLNLKGNPVTEELTYRVAFIAAMPQLRVLDDHEITAAERHAAERYRRAQLQGKQSRAQSAPIARKAESSAKRRGSEDAKDVVVSSVYSHLVAKVRAADHEERKRQATGAGNNSERAQTAFRRRPTHVRLRTAQSRSLKKTSEPDKAVKLNPIAPDYFSMFSYDVDPVPVTEAARLDHRRPWRTAHIGRRKTVQKVLAL